MSLNQNDLDWYAARLSLAVYDTNRETPEMSVSELKDALKDIPGIEGMTLGYARNGDQVITVGSKSVEVGPMASNEEIRLALQNPTIRTENTRMSIITGYVPGAIQAKLNDIKQKATVRRTAAFAKLDEAHTKLAGVDAQIEAVATQIEKEADLALHEFAQFTNGAPE